MEEKEKKQTTPLKHKIIYYGLLFLSVAFNAVSVVLNFIYMFGGKNNTVRIVGAVLLMTGLITLFVAIFYMVVYNKRRLQKTKDIVVEKIEDKKED